MIGYIKGRIEEVEDNSVIIDKDGIGFRVFMPINMEDKQYRTGTLVKVFTYLNVKEDLLQLFGFFRKEDLKLFELLIGVNGVGPKAGLSILSGIGGDTLRFAVLSDDAAAIAKAPGIGKKTAQKIILELKDKLSLSEAFEQKLDHNSADSIGEGADDGNASVKDAVEALTALGYSKAQAMQAVRKVEIVPDMQTEDILKAALKYIF